jgi:CPA1 family monovalent cation:H+ antiporter
MLVGLVIAWLVVQVLRRLFDPAIEIAVSLLTPYGAYLPAEQIGVSGVLATVAAGLCAGWWAPTLTEPDTRLRSRAVWDIVTFLLNRLVFILIGLQLLRIVPALSSHSFESLIGLGVLLSTTAIVVRFASVLGAGRLSHAPGQQVGALALSTRARTIVGWAGMRGVVSLAQCSQCRCRIPSATR